jgi:long-chain acyl-CoA synthetase
MTTPCGERDGGDVQTYPEFRNLAAMMLGLARAWPRRPMLRYHRDDAWHSIDWGTFGRMVASAARRLAAAGIAPGDRVLIVADNRPEYNIAEVALMAIRAIPVPTYTTNTVADHAHILRDCGARAAIVGTGALAGMLREAGPLDLLVAMDSPEWTALVGDDASLDDLAAEADTIAPGALACLIYTSGTGGLPKGVMLPHAAILSNCRGAFELLRQLDPDDEVYLSFLPLSHAYEHTVGGYFLPSLGAEVVYARGVEHLGADMAIARPTIMTVVPRVLEVIRARVLIQVARAPAWRRWLFERALAVGLKRLDGENLSPLDRLLDPLLDRLVRGKVRARFGGRLKALVSGGARLEPEVGRFFLALGVRVLQGYGQTEAGPVVAANPPFAIRIDTVGPPLLGVEARIAEDGEILLRGDLVMAGYWGQPAATAEAIRDGWLHTGDIGVLDPDGYLRITDRKKDMIVLSGGDNVSPARIEGKLIAEPEIAQAVVLGEGEPALSALLVAAEGCGEAEVAGAVKRVNRHLSVVERVRHHTVVEAFTLENGFLTPTQKIKRRVVMEAYAERLRAAPPQPAPADRTAGRPA